MTKSLRLVAVLACLAAGGCAPTPTPQTPPSATETGPTDASQAAGDAPVLESPGLDTDGAVGQTLYVPVYSHIYSQDGARETDLAVTISVRNTDPEHTVTFGTLRYHDSDGQLVRTYPGATLGPLASRAYVVAEDDRTGGVGANVVVQWEAPRAVASPVVEAVMISTAGTQGITFVSRARVVRPLADAR